MNNMKEKSGTVAVIVVLIVLSFFFGRATVKPKVVEKIKTIKEIVYDFPGNLTEICDNLHKQEIFRHDAYYEGWKAGLNAR